MAHKVQEEGGNIFIIRPWKRRASPRSNNPLLLQFWVGVWEAGLPQPNRCIREEEEEEASLPFGSGAD